MTFITSDVSMLVSLCCGRGILTLFGGAPGTAPGRLRVLNEHTPRRSITEAGVMSKECLTGVTMATLFETEMVCLISSHTHTNPE